MDSGSNELSFNKTIQCEIAKKICINYGIKISICIGIVEFMGYELRKST